MTVAIQSCPSLVSGMMHSFNNCAGWCTLPSADTFQKRINLDPQIFKLQPSEISQIQRVFFSNPILQAQLANSLFNDVIQLSEWRNKHECVYERRFMPELYEKGLDASTVTDGKWQLIATLIMVRPTNHNHTLLLQKSCSLHREGRCHVLGNVPWTIVRD